MKGLGTYCIYGRIRNFVWKSQGKGPHGRRRIVLKLILKRDREGVDRIYLDLGKNHWRFLLKRL
jgi:hypothetical protein